MNDQALTPSPTAHDAAALLHLGLDSTLGRSAAPPIAPPELPGFSQLELIGRGGMGVVYRALQDSLERTVAIKVIAAELSSDPEFEARFVREARLLARLHHPNIVGVIDHGRCDGNLYLVMEHVEGRTLRDALSQPMAPDVALRIASQVCDALAYSHGCGIVHRDIKPENILLDATGRVRVADFGLSKALGDRTSSSLTGSRVMGTPMYMAPEQLADPHHTDHRVDLWALGIMLYEMLTGQLPLGRFAPPSKLVATPRGTDAVLERALQPDPAARFQDAGEVKRELDALPVTAMRPKTATDASARRNQWWAFGAVMLPCVVIFASPAWGAARPAMGIAFVVLVLGLYGYTGYQMVRFRGESRAACAEAALLTGAVIIGATMLSGFDFFGETFGIQALSPGDDGTRVAWQTMGALVIGAAALAIATFGHRHGVRVWSLLLRGRLVAR